VNYFVAPTKDQPNYDIRKDMLNAMLFIRMAVSDGGVVLVHCHAGISRSVTVMLAYLMFFEGMILEDALKHLRQRRPQANPNRGFMRCLKKFENQLLAPYYSSDPANLSKYYSHQ
jgi:protein-tyrosine phosphatase